MRDCLRARLHRAFSRPEQDADRFARAALAGTGEMLVRQRLAGCAAGVKPVGLRAVAPRRPLGPIDFDDPLTALEQERGHPGTEAASAFDRPAAAPWGALLSEAQQP